MVYPSGNGTQIVLEKRPLNDCVCVCCNVQAFHDPDNFSDHDPLLIVLIFNWNCLNENEYSENLPGIPTFDFICNRS